MRKIVIDVGHGGLDPGASGNKMLEKKINYNVAVKLKELLKADGFDVYMTRNADESIDIPKRAAFANKINPDLVISIHHNAGGGHGYDIVYNLSKPLSRTIADLIASEFGKLGQTRHKVFSRESGVIPGADYYGIQRLIKAPCVITEYAFIDSTDGKDIDTLTEQWNEAKAIALALKKWKG